MAIEVERWPDGTINFLRATFCTRAHAAEWLTNSLPEPQPPVDVRWSIRDRLFDFGFALLLFLIVALAMLGVYSLMRFLGAWD